MGVSRIEQIIEDIYDFVESCKPQAFSTSKVVVQKDELYDLLDELKLRTPDEIKRYQKIIANRDAIIADAEEKAGAILLEAQQKTSALVSESEIMQQAYNQANDVVNLANEEAMEILRAANEDANEVRTGALSYADEVLTEVEKVLAHSYDSAKSHCDNLVDTLRGNLEILSNNRGQIVSQLYGAQMQQDAAAAAEEGRESEQPSDEYDIDEDKFLENIDLNS